MSSFLERAKAAATEAMAKADQALATSGLMTPPEGAGVERALRDYGLLAWRAAHGASVDPVEQERVTSALAAADAAGRLQYLTVAPPPAAAPPPPGYAAAASAAGAPPPPSYAAGPGSAPAPAGGSVGSDAPSEPAVVVEDTGPHGGHAPPPPPPSWA